MSPPPRIFLETNALKLASERILRAYRVPKVVQWGSAAVTIPMVRWYEEYPNHRLGRRQWRLILEISCLPSIAWMARQGRVELLCTEEVVTELRGLPKTDDPRGLFYGAPITRVKAPAYATGSGLLERLVYPRAQRRPNARERQLEFMGGIQRQRFLELQKATGAYQGPGKPPHKNQLWDAFHVWSAECAGADFSLGTRPGVSSPGGATKSAVTALALWRRFVFAYLIRFVLQSEPLTQPKRGVAPNLASLGVCPNL